MNSESKTCQNCKQEFVIEPDDFAFYEKMKVPAPTWCPECRTRRRIVWRNEKTLYKHKCDATGKMVFSMFHPDSPAKVYERDYWWSDAWDALSYGKDIDFSRPFLEQVKELLGEVPWPSRSVINLTNSDYCMNCSYLKNCYLVFHASYNEDCLYSVGMDNSKSCADVLFGQKCELCYEGFSLSGSYKLLYCNECHDSQDLVLCRDCTGCSNCFGCVGLRNKKYHIWNKSYSKEEYAQKIASLRLSSYKNLLKLKEEFDAFVLKRPVKYIHGNHNQNVSGEYIYHSKNVLNSYRVVGSENCKYCQNISLPPGGRDCYDYSFFGKNAELVYEGSSIGIDASNIKFCVFVYNGAKNVEYSIMCPSSDCFGCVNLRGKQFCILNKQYTKEEYEALVPRIIKHMNEMPYTDKKGRVYKYGEFFPPEFSPFGYNDTVAQEYFPYTKQEAEKMGFPWQDASPRDYEPTLTWKELPDDIKDVDDSILQQTILCQSWEEEGSEKALEHSCSQAYKITAAELAFYKRLGIPLPRRCFNSRHNERTKQRNPLRLWHRQCMKPGCNNEFETSYEPNRPEIVYCESCYNAEVV